MTIVEKAAYLKGLTDGLGIDPQSKDGRLWAALNELMGDIAHEIEALHETDRGQAQALDGVAEQPVCGRCSRPCMTQEEPEDGAEDRAYAPEEGDEELQYDGVIYDATCPVCGEEISFDEETLERGSIRCPKCGEILEFDLGGDETEQNAPEEHTEGPRA